MSIYYFPSKLKGNAIKPLPSAKNVVMERAKQMGWEQKRLVVQPLTEKGKKWLT